MRRQLIQKFAINLLGYGDSQLLNLLQYCSEIDLYNDFVTRLLESKDYTIYTALTIIKYALINLNYEEDYGDVYFKIKNDELYFLVEMCDGDELGEDKIVDYYNAETKIWEEKVGYTMFSEEELNKALNLTKYKVKEIIIEAECGTPENYVRLCQIGHPSQ